MRFLSLGAIPVVVLGLTYAANPVMCEEAEATAITFQYSGIRYASLNSSVKPKSGSSTDVSSTDLSTTGIDSYAWITHGKWNFYLYPFTGGTLVGLSYLPNATWEFGSFLGLEQTKTDENKASKNASLVSPFVTYYHTISNITLENYLSLDVIQSTEESTDATTGTKTESEANGMGFTLQVTAVYPLSKTFFLVPSIKYASFSSKDKADTETTDGLLVVTPFALRTTFN